MTQEQPILRPDPFAKHSWAVLVLFVLINAVILINRLYVIPIHEQNTKESIAELQAMERVKEAP